MIYYLYLIDNTFKHMFKKSAKDKQLDAFSSVANVLVDKAFKEYTDDKHWHNQFRNQIVNHIDESIFSILFNETQGAPNAPVRILVGMMILKDAFGLSDSQLFEQCHFNLLIRSALGLFNMSDALPVTSTYYLLRKRIYEYQKQGGEDLMTKVFETITSQQIKEFDVNGRKIRMDSKLIGSNIALYSRFEIIHHTLSMFYNSLNNKQKYQLSKSDNQQLVNHCQEEPEKTIYHSTKQEIQERLQPMGLMIHKILNQYRHLQTEEFRLLKRVFTEQYKIADDQKVELRPKEEISSSSVQSPHDPDCAYRHKEDQNVKGYSVNITETCSDDGLNLITSVIVEKANTPDTSFVEPAIEQTILVTQQHVEKTYVDGAYQSPANDSVCENIDIVYTGIQGFESRYTLEETSEGVWVTDNRTGEKMKAILAKKLKNSKEDRWRINTIDGPYYFSRLAIRASMLRRQLKERSPQELNKRCNVESTIFHFAFTLRNKKTRYRGIIKNRMWSVVRCLWINLLRIVNFSKQLCQRTLFSMKSALDSLNSTRIFLVIRLNNSFLS